jgi:hypothetical protein
VGMLLLVSSCNPFKARVPAIESALPPHASLTLWCDIVQLPMQWEAIAERLQASEPWLRSQLGDAVVDALQQSGLSPSDFHKVVFALEAIPTEKNLSSLEWLSTVKWVLGMEIHGFVPADMLVFAINSSGSDTPVRAHHGGEWGPFERIDIHDASAGTLLFSIAIHSDRISQIRIGHPSTIEPGLALDAPSATFAGNLPGHQLHYQLRMSEQWSESIKQLEATLPIDTGTLLSGFQLTSVAHKWTDYLLHTQVCASFSDIESADTAYSILNLLNRFAIKPSVRKMIPDARDFTQSLSIERSGSQLFYHGSLNEKDTRAVRTYFQEAQHSEWLAFAFDLILAR